MTAAMTLGMRVGELTEDWSSDARYFEYSRAANPIGAGYTPLMPIQTFPAKLHKGGPTRIVPLDLSASLGIETGPATSPALLAHFVHIRPGERIATAPNGARSCTTSSAVPGFSLVNGEAVAWGAATTITLPAGSRSAHYADEDVALYWVMDEPLLRYLGAEASVARFAPTKFEAATARSELERVAADPHAGQRSRISILLANASQAQTLTVTHVLWAMFGVVPAGSAQRPHRHQSVALDLCVEGSRGCYTLLGADLDDEGHIIDPVRVDWAPGAVFTTHPACGTLTSTSPGSQHGSFQSRMRVCRRTSDPSTFASPLAANPIETFEHGYPSGWRHTVSTATRGVVSIPSVATIWVLIHLAVWASRGPNYFLVRVACSEPLVALPGLYERAPVPARRPRSTMRYSSRIARPSKKHSRISRVPAA